MSALIIKNGLRNRIKGLIKCTSGLRLTPNCDCQHWQDKTSSRMIDKTNLRITGLNQSFKFWGCKIPGIVRNQRSWTTSCQKWRRHCWLGEPVWENKRKD